MRGGSFRDMARAAGVAALVAALYWICGRLGLLLAIPPGYATAVWPASGLALAAAIRLGPAGIVGTALGSFLINAAGPTAGGLPAFVIPLAIAFGASSQAALGAALVRRFVGSGNLLEQEGGAVRLLLIGGPLACLVNPTVSVAALRLAGTIPDSTVWLNWWTWWVGDSIGVLIFTPIVLAWTVRPYRQWWQRQLLVTVPLAALFVTVVALFVFVSRREEARIEAGFEAVTARLGRDLQEDLGNVMAALGALEGFYASSDRVRPYEFQIFAGRLLQVLPAVRALSWNPVVEGSERAAFERGLGAPIRSLSGRQPADGGRALPVELIVPRQAEEMIGVDELSEPARREAIERAADTGQVMATARVRLADGREGLLAFMPIYRQGVQPTSVEARRKYLRGFAVAGFDLEQLMAAVATAALDEGLALTVFDEDVEGEPLKIFEEATAAGAGPAALQEEFRFNFAGRQLRLRLELREQALLAQRSWETWMVLAGGLGLASLLGMMLLLAVGREARVAAHVEAATADLRRLNLDLTAQIGLRARLESEAEKRAAELSASNTELQRRADVNRQLLVSLRHSESELRRTATQLAASNRELEQFAYVASHDLKAPLRSIGSFAQLLDRRYGAGLGDEAKEFLGFIQDGILQMQALIDDLLQLSRVDPRRLELGPVSLGQVVDRACRALTADIGTSRARIELGPLPEVEGDANLLAQLLQNLIGNAIKFQKPGNVPEVCIEAAETPESCHVTVRDNGIGIDPRHLEQVFLVFKRLHTTDQYPGNGIGLAVCKKVVALHGGEIWAESLANAGTTFHFTLPRRAEPGGRAGAEPANRAAA